MNAQEVTEETTAFVKTLMNARNNMDCVIRNVSIPGDHTDAAAKLVLR